MKKKNKIRKNKIPRNNEFLVMDISCVVCSFTFAIFCRFYTNFQHFDNLLAIFFFCFIFKSAQNYNDMSHHKCSSHFFIMPATFYDIVHGIFRNFFVGISIFFFGDQNQLLLNFTLIWCILLVIKLHSIIKLLL